MSEEFAPISFPLMGEGRVGVTSMKDRDSSGYITPLPIEGRGYSAVDALGSPWQRECPGRGYGDDDHRTA